MEFTGSRSWVHNVGEPQSEQRNIDVDPFDNVNRGSTSETEGAVGDVDSQQQKPDSSKIDTDIFDDQTAEVSEEYSPPNPPGTEYSEAASVNAQKSQLNGVENAPKVQNKGKTTHFTKRFSKLFRNKKGK